MTTAGPGTAPGSMRLPTTVATRQTALAIAATAVGTIGLVPGVPHPLSALLLAVFVGVGPGCAVLAWLPTPPISRVFLVPALGLAAVVIVTAAAAWIGWWSPFALFGVIALLTLWSVIPTLRSLVADMVP